MFKDPGEARNTTAPLGSPRPPSTPVNFAPSAEPKAAPVHSLPSSTAVPSVDEWGLLSEPWIFAVDGDGIVRGSYEGVVTDGELEAVFEAISGT